MDTTQSLSRRTMLRLLGGAALATVPALGLAGQASAGRAWCRADPWVVINGTHLQVYPERDAAEKNTSTGPIKLIFTEPPRASYTVLDSDAGFGYGYDISFVESTKLSAGQYRVDMNVPAASPMAVQLVCDPVNPSAKTTSKFGYANTWIKVITKI